LVCIFFLQNEILLGKKIILIGFILNYSLQIISLKELNP